ncbi:hypothetical protein OUZ56_031796 [Daphnia magna]|uniref:Uncharacterized protein n=1 Tax=Daphnia magna TaxID=35525 RepID=A0ABQ9ZVB2_9CRUS|nr:hypothetical protein OUZ56_031796 [Daphnia magna]
MRTYSDSGQPVNATFAVVAFNRQPSVVRFRKELELGESHSGNCGTLRWSSVAVVILAACLFKVSFSKFSGFILASQQWETAQVYDEILDVTLGDDITFRFLSCVPHTTI